MSIDPVASLLKSINKEDIVKKLNLKQDEVKTAIHYHNQITDELKNLRDFKELHQRQGNANDQQGQSRALEKANSSIKRLQEENESLGRQLDELRMRFSKVAGQKLTEGNPNITDLSDQYRPTKLAEHFRTMYDDDWTHAFEDLEKAYTAEETILETIAGIIKKADEFCADIEKQQMKKITDLCTAYIIEYVCTPAYTTPQNRCIGTKEGAENKGQKEKDIVIRHLRDVRKSIAHLSKEPVGKIFCDLHVKGKIGKSDSKGLEQFSMKLIHVVWMMKIQEPPIEFIWQKPGDTYKKDMFSEYTQRGQKVVRTVWPAVILHKDGPLLTKGIVQVAK